MYIWNPVYSTGTTPVRSRGPSTCCVPVQVSLITVTAANTIRQVPIEEGPDTMCAHWSSSWRTDAMSTQLAYLPEVMRSAIHVVYTTACFGYTVLCMHREWGCANVVALPRKCAII